LIDTAALKLLVWLSPAFPTGAFAYSHGIEWAVETGDITDQATLLNWVADVLRLGAGRSDAIVLRAAMACPPLVGGRDLAGLAIALAPSRERLAETLHQGTAFAAAAAPWGAIAPDLPYPVAVGLLAAAHGIDPDIAAAALLQAFAANLISAAVRLVPLGQTTGLAVLAALEPVIAEVAAETRTAGLDDIGGACFRSDIAAMRHETQYTRLFRS
jgi:urease accessory protein